MILKMEMDIQPFSIPQYVFAKSKPGLKQDGFQENPKQALKELISDILDKLCIKFCKDVFKQAEICDPHEM